MIQPLFAGPSVERLVAEHIFPVYSLQLVPFHRDDDGLF
jgi:hypothetical protein